MENVQSSSDADVTPRNEPKSKGGSGWIVRFKGWSEPFSLRCQLAHSKGATVRFKLKTHNDSERHKVSPTSGKRRWSKNSMRNAPKSVGGSRPTSHFEGWFGPFSLGSQLAHSKGATVRFKLKNYTKGDTSRTADAVTAIREDEEPLEWPCLDPIVYGVYRPSEKTNQN